MRRSGRWRARWSCGPDLRRRSSSSRISRCSTASSPTRGRASITTSRPTRRRPICCCSACASRRRCTILWRSSATSSGCASTFRTLLRRRRSPARGPAPGDAEVGDAQSESSSLGARLRNARERSGLTVIQAAERLHVDPQLIEALEGERFEQFGASVYVRGHIRHYAELVGESAEELQQLYSGSAHAAQQPDLTRVPKEQDPAGASSALLVPAVMVVAVVAVIGIVWWVAGTLNAARLQHRGPTAAFQ